MLERADSPPSPSVHPRGSRARILLTSVFGPYAVDDEYGSRRVNPMELHHNQVTRVQGAFSLRMFHRSWGLMMIQSNLEAPCTLLDFPDLVTRLEAEQEHEVWLMLPRGDYETLGQRFALELVEGAPPILNDGVLVRYLPPGLGP